MHYQKGIFGYESRADSPSFFFASEGKTNPLEELKASYLKFKNIEQFTDINKDPRCLFPARFDFIKENLDPDLIKPKCNDFDDWINALDPKTVALVFTNNFPSNPASIFGHTFLRIVSSKEASVQKNNTGDEIKIDLLDYFVGFSAHVENPSFMQYLSKGLSGGFPGKFEMGPYYMKVSEYNNMENRDIWEFELNLTQNQARRLVSHIWELSMSTHFDYYFFDENCSTMLLYLFQIANPNWDLINDNPLYLAPPETVKPLANIEGAITKISYRPSLYRKYQHRVNILDTKQKNILKGIIANEINIDTISDPYPLEAAINFFLFLKKSNPKSFNEKYEHLYFKLLKARAQIKGQTNAQFNEVTSNSRPDLSHGDNLLTLGLGINKQRSFEEITFRPALHDLLASDVGQPKYSSVEVLKTKIRIHNKKDNDAIKLRIQEITFIKMGSLFPISNFESKWSYFLEVKNYIPKDINCISCNTWHLSGQAGKALELIPDRILTYALIGTRVESQSNFKNNLRYGPDLNLGVHFRYEKYRNNLGLKSFWDLNQSDRQKQSYLFSFENSWTLNQNNEIRLNSSFYPNSFDKSAKSFENSLEYFLYF